MSDSVINARRTYQLADDNTLGTIDHKRTGRCHQRQVAHEDLVLRDLVLLLIDQANLHLKRRRVSSISLFAFLNRVLHILFA